MKQTKIREISTHPTDTGELVAVEFTDTDSATFFSDNESVSLDGIEVGDSVKVEVEEAGDHRNITDIEKIASEAQTTTQEDPKKKGLALKVGAYMSEDAEETKKKALDFYNFLKQDWEDLRGDAL